MLSIGFFILALICFARSEREDVHQLMYKTLPGTQGCFRRLNGTHQFGCSTPKHGVKGVIHILAEESELERFLKNATNDPYAVILSPRSFTRNVIEKLISSNKVSGIVLATHLGTHSDYSPDSVCPNEIMSQCNTPWNPYANDLLHMDWGMPLFLVDDEDNFKLIKDCYNKFNTPLESQSKSLCSLKMKSHMFAAVNSKLCLRRVSMSMLHPVKYCDPLGNENIILPMKIAKKYIVIATRMDSTTLFDGIAPGAMSSVTGLVSLLTIAKMLNGTLDNAKTGVILMIFNGEAFDYIGSSRVVYDMENDNFLTKNIKIKTEDIQLFIEVSQLSDGDHYLHLISSDSYKTNITNEFKQAEKNYGIKLNIVDDNLIPPTSYVTFYNSKKNINAAIITNYDKRFENKNYNGLFDNAANLHYEYANGTTQDYILQSRIANISATIADVVGSLVNNKYEKGHISSYYDTVDQLLYCYLVSRKCPYFNNIYPAIASGRSQEANSMYVGVQLSISSLTKGTGAILAYFGSKQAQVDKDNCNLNSDDYMLMWINDEHGNSICLNTTIKFTPAVSPAFMIDNYDWESRKYSTWTESVWEEGLQMTLFIKPSRSAEISVLIIGIFTSVFSFFIVYFLKEKSNSLFLNEYPTSC